MADTLLQTVVIVLYVVCWPFIKLFQVLASVLSPFWVVGQFMLLPVTYLVHAILHIILFPFRLQLLEKLETIYIYLGIAGLIGCITGAILFLSINILSSMLRIDARAGTQPRHEHAGRTAAEFRATRRKRMEDTRENRSTPPVARISGPSQGRRGVGSQAILKEEDRDL
ncbi:hypothetical protein BCR34DRAFT_496483 [Clohesyomyces aquaticus]|uniref:Uncharacterized protein n=1 Tax=Clohesyomyces aquaticus TaxID=1231657 RepID=A0A1Y1YIY7_9PLEO|nr:hypothetical protein BCR34DRAFT_496483 [Clohesyomyces aquaticus]